MEKVKLRIAELRQRKNVTQQQLAEIVGVSFQTISKWENGECVFVDNSVKNLRAAEEFGIQTILFDRDGEDYDGRVVNDFAELEKMLKNI